MGAPVSADVDLNIICKYKQYICTADKGVGAPVIAEVDLNILCKYKQYICTADNGVGPWCLLM